MCEGAFSSPASMCFAPVVADHALEGGLEVARDGRIGVLVDDHQRSMHAGT